MTRRIPLLLLTVLLTSHGIVVAEIVRDHPDEQLAANVAEVVAKINAGDSAQLERFVRERYAASMLQGMSVEAMAGRANHQPNAMPHPPNRAAPMSTRPQVTRRAYRSRLISPQCTRGGGRRSNPSSPSC